MATSKAIDGRSKPRPGIEEQTQIIIDAAIELFIEQGTNSTSIAQICARADVSKPTFYRCFKDKDALIAQLYQQSINAHVDTLLLATMRQNISAEQNLDKALDKLLDAIFEQASLAQLLFREYGDPNSPAAKIIDSTFERIAKALQKNIKQNGQEPPSRTFLKAMMAAFQWVVHDTIKAGLTPHKIKEAKKAAHELAAVMYR